MLITGCCCVRLLSSHTPVEYCPLAFRVIQCIPWSKNCALAGQCILMPPHRRYAVVTVRRDGGIAPYRFTHLWKGCASAVERDARPYQLSMRFCRLLNKCATNIDLNSHRFRQNRPDKIRAAVSHYRLEFFRSDRIRRQREWINRCHKPRKDSRYVITAASLQRLNCR